MTETWTTTTDTRIAAAMGTLGVPVRLRTTLIEKTAQRVTRFHLALCSLDRQYDTRRILHRFKHGKLEGQEPAHPFLTILRAFENRRLLLDFQNKGHACTLGRVEGTPLWQYAPGGSALPGCHGRGEVIRTADIKAVAALGIVGLPLLMIEGGGHAHQYHLPRYGPALEPGGQPVDGVALLRDWYADKASIPWEHPFAQAARGLYNRERFLDAVTRDIELVLLQKPASQKSALIRANASPKAFDSVKRHFEA